MKYILLGISVLLCTEIAIGQIKLTEQEAIDLAIKTHPAIASAQLHVDQQNTLLGIKRYPQPAQIYHSVTADPDLGLFGTSTFGIQQIFTSGRENKARRSGQEAKLRLAQVELALTRTEAVRHVREIYHHLSYLQEKSRLLTQVDSMWLQAAKSAEVRKRSGDISQVDLLALKNQAAQVRLEARTIAHEIEYDRLVLGKLVGVQEGVEPLIEPLKEEDYSLSDTARLLSSARMAYSQNLVSLAEAEKAMIRAGGTPVPVLGGYGQLLGNGAFFPGWYIGVQAPLNRAYLQKQTQAAQIASQSAEADYKASLLEQQNEMGHLLHELEKYQISLSYYNAQGKELAAEILRSSQTNYQLGEMDYGDFVALMHQATEIELRHLEDLLGLSLTLIELEALVAKP